MTTTWDSKLTSAIEAYIAYARWCFDSESNDYLQKLSSLVEDYPALGEFYSDINIDAYRAFFDQYSNADTAALFQTVQDYLDANESPTPINVSNYLEDDRRFRHPAWKTVPYFNTILKNYAYTVQMIELTPAEGIALFHRDRFISALAPTNSIFFNPEVMEKAINTEGASLLKGMRAMREDIDPTNALLQIRTCDKQHFLVGDNLASSDGQVVYENELIELIYYPAQVESVFERPLLIAPPWINKFYILDLQERNSLVGYLTEQGYDVFMISWRNPRLGIDNFSMDDYANDGLIKATETVCSLTGSDKINITGYCIGGILLASTYATKIDAFQKRVASLSFFTTLLDFSEAGEVRYLVEDSTNPIAQHWLDEQHGLPKVLVGASFQYLRPDQLIWPNVIHFYYLGDPAPPSALMYWNSDGTQLTQNVVNWMREKAYGTNLLAMGEVDLLEKPIDLQAIDATDCYFVAAEKDHIAPWPAVFQSAATFAPSARFILTESGHIAGIVHDPSLEKYHHKVVNVALNREQALEQAEQRNGSWWLDWNNWLSERSGTRKVRTDIPKYPYIRKAPGRYVHQ